MKFGKLKSIENIEFSLPPDTEASNIFFNKIEKEEKKATIYIGCTGWSMREWVGKVYPPKTKATDYLHHYSRQFNTIEFNTTHYRIPNGETVEKWRTKSADDFRFCPKIPQLVSHRNDLGMTSGKMLEFCESIQELGEKMGCCFMQLPPYFSPDRSAVLKQFIEKFPNHIPLAIEFRQEDWFKNDTLNPITALMRKKGMPIVITDVAGRRDVLHMETTSEIAMIRFVGNDLHPTDFERIDEWIERLNVWISNGVKNIYFFCHEPDNIMAPDLCKYLFEKISILKNIETRGPKFIEPNGGQLELF